MIAHRPKPGGLPGSLRSSLPDSFAGKIRTCLFMTAPARHYTCIIRTKTYLVAAGYSYGRLPTDGRFGLHPFRQPGPGRGPAKCSDETVRDFHSSENGRAAP